jgi:hypothetical protein
VKSEAAGRFWVDGKLENWRRTKRILGCSVKLWRRRVSSLIFGVVFQELWLWNGK